MDAKQAAAIIQKAMEDVQIVMSAGYDPEKNLTSAIYHMHFALMDLSDEENWPIIDEFAELFTEEDKELEKRYATENEVDGVAILAINESGEKAIVLDRIIFDKRLESVCWEDRCLEEQLNPNNYCFDPLTTDCLYISFFKYKVIPPSSYFEDDAEELALFLSGKTLKQNYKEFFRLQIALDVVYYLSNELDEDTEPTYTWIDEEIEKFQMLYDEDYELPELHKQKYGSFADIDWQKETKDNA